MILNDIINIYKKKVSSPSNPIYQSTYHNNRIFSKMGYDMENERLQQWKEYILPIHMDIAVPNEHKYNEKEEKKDDHENDIETSSSELNDNDNEENFLSINPRTIMIDDYLNYHNLNKNTMIKRKESGYNSRDGSVTSKFSTDSNLDANPRTENYKTGLEISKQMDFKPDHQDNRFYHQYHHHSYSYNYNSNYNLNHSHSHSYSDCYYSDPSTKSDESSTEYFQHTYCNPCQQMMKDQQKRHRGYSLSMEGLKKEMMDNFCLLLLDVNKVYYSNYDYIPLKILEYTRTYSVQEEIMKSRSYENNYPSHESLDYPSHITLKNTYTSLNFENLENVKFLHSNRLLDSAPLVSSPTISTSHISSSHCVNNNSVSEKWDCSTVNYAFITN